MKEAGVGLTLAAAVVACAAVLFVLIPVAIALLEPVVPLVWLGDVAAGVGAALGGVKLLAIAWAVGARLLRPHPAPASRAFAD